MIDINISNLNKRFGENEILKDLNLTVKRGEKLALIGENGCGKTTLLNIIAGQDGDYEGIISIGKHVKLGYLKQSRYINQNKLVKDILYSSIKEILVLKDKLERLEEKLLKSIDLDRTITLYSKTQEQFINLGGYEIDSKINKLLNKFKVNKELLDRNYNDLSGGEKSIITLISILLNNPNILILDEPNNHLDMDTLDILEDYLKDYKGTIILVSHDRYFIDKVTNRILLLEDGKIESFNGNYSYYLEEYNNQIENEFKKYKDQQKMIKAMEEAIKKLHEFGGISGNERFYKRAESIRKRLERMEKISKPKDKKELPLEFSIKNKYSQKVLNLDNINISYDNNIILNNAFLTVNNKDKICLLGSNGCGKTTLIKYILSNNDNLKIGYMSQNINFENDNLTVYEEARKYFIGEEHHLRSALCKFYFFKYDINKRVKMLSGGEKVRLKLFCLMQEEYDLLVFDEPTNHIDIVTIEILENTLSEYKGTLLLTSHDRYFINKVCNKIIYFDNKKLRYLNGNYDYYKDHKNKFSSI